MPTLLDIEVTLLPVAPQLSDTARRASPELRAPKKFILACSGQAFGSNGTIVRYDAYLQKPNEGVTWHPVLHIHLEGFEIFTYIMPHATRVSMVDFALQHTWELLQANWWHLRNSEAWKCITEM